ncbi:MAG: alpha/beta fold hydrolase [Desulfobacterium sp.]
MTTRTNSKNWEYIILTAEDGYPLGATRYNASGRINGHLIVAGATGVCQTFYHHFAEYASRRGYTTLTFDYRGIGKSKPSNLKGFKMNFLDWARLDLAGAVNEMANDTVPLYIVGHSFGGHAFGLLPNHHRVERFYTFATGAGWHGWMPFFEGLRVRVLWKVILPMFTKWKGYLPWSILNMGEDLPLAVYQQWRHWCRFPHYFFDDPQMAYIKEDFASVKTPIIAANSMDDPWALPRSRDAFMWAYRNAPLECIDIDARQFPGGLGHMGYFRVKAKPLWENVFEWFNQPR